MNATVRTVLVFLLLVGAVVFASLLYRGSANGSVPAEPVAAAPLHPELKLGLEALAEGREEESLTHFLSVPANSPHYPSALRNVAIVNARQGNYDEAIFSLKEMVNQSPDDPEVHASLGWVFYLAGRYREAEFAALRALELEPLHISTRFNIGLYRIAQGRTQLAISSYIRAMRGDPNGEHVARHRERLRSFHDAHPDSPGAHYALAFFADSMRDPRTEIDELEHYLELAGPGPERDAAERQLADARASLGGS